MSFAGRSLWPTIVGKLAVLTTLTAYAHTPSVPSARLAQCAAIAVAAQRLSCYDALATSVLPARQTARADAGSFGLPPPQLAISQGPPAIRVRVQGVTADPYGDTVVQLDNGQTWQVQQADAPLWRGESVTIRRAALGSFLLTTSDRRSYRVERLR